MNITENDNVEILEVGIAVTHKAPFAAVKASINICGYNYEEYNKILIESYGN